MRRTRDGSCADTEAESAAAERAGNRTRRESRRAPSASGGTIDGRRADIHSAYELRRNCSCVSPCAKASTKFSLQPSASKTQGGFFQHWCPRPVPAKTPGAEPLEKGSLRVWI